MKLPTIVSALKVPFSTASVSSSQKASIPALSSSLMEEMLLISPPGVLIAMACVLHEA